MVEKVIDNINGSFYSYILIPLLILGGLYFTVRTGFVQIRLLKEQFRAVTEKPKDKTGVSSFQALMVSTASRVGTGNIVGVSTALCLGGFGSMFWMWVIAIIGAASAFVESTLAQIYKKRGNGESYGGPAYYIEAACGKRMLAVLFSVLLIVTYGIGFNMLASYNLQSTFSSYGFYNKEITPWIIGGITAFAVAFCLFGGGKRIIKVTTTTVPVMGVAYIAIALIITLINITELPQVFKTIFADAFNLKAIFGGFSGSCMKNGHTADSDDAQSLVKELQNYITENYYTCTNQILAGLGQMYVADERFQNNINKNGNGTAEFVSKAIEIYGK